MDTVQPVHFWFGARPANSKFATKTVPYNNLLTELARAVLGNIGPLSWWYGAPARLVSG